MDARPEGIGSPHLIGEGGPSPRRSGSDPEPVKLGAQGEARRLGDRAVESSAGHPGFAAHAQHLLGDVATHPDRFDVESGEAHYR